MNKGDKTNKAISFISWLCLDYFELVSQFIGLSRDVFVLYTNRRSNKRRVKISLTKYTSHFICKGSKRLLKVCVWEGVGDRTEASIFWPPLLWPATLSLSRSLGLLNRRSRGSALCWVMAFFSASYQQLISNWSGPQTPSGFPRAPSAGCSFPYPISSITSSRLQLELWLLSWLSYVIVQRPLNRLLDLWNDMIDRHPVEITVMQVTLFRCISL